MEFKIGDRVRGKAGTVVDICDKLIGIEFDEPINGHDGNGRGKDGHCWYCESNTFEKVPETSAKDNFKEKIEISTDGEKIQAEYVKDNTLIARTIDCTDNLKNDVEKVIKNLFFNIESNKIFFNKEKSLDWDKFKNNEVYVQVTENNFDDFIKECAEHELYFTDNNYNPFKDKVFDVFTTLSKFLVESTKMGTISPENTIYINCKDNLLKGGILNTLNKEVFVW